MDIKVSTLSDNFPRSFSQNPVVNYWGKLRMTADQVRIGDIVFLAVGAEKQGTDFICLAALGLNSDNIGGMEAQSYMKHARLSLFKIESVFTIKTEDQELDQRARRTEETQSLGQGVYYGDWVQLRHLFSSKLLAVTNEHDHKDVGRYKAVLKDNDDETCWIRVMSRKQDQEGQQVKYNENILLCFRKNLLDFYIGIKKNLNTYEIETLQIPFDFKIHKYEGCKDSGKSEGARKVMAGDFVKLKHKASNQYLASASESDNLFWLRRLKDVWKSSSLSKKIRKMIEALENFAAPQIKLTDAKVPYEGCWIIEYPRSLKGGPINWGQSFYLKNALSNKYLSNDLTLLDDVDDRTCLFSSKEVKVPTDNFILYGAELFIGENEHYIYSHEEQDLEALCRQILPSQKATSSAKVWKNLDIRTIGDTENADNAVIQMLPFLDFEGQLLEMSQLFTSFIRNHFIPALDRFNSNSSADIEEMNQLCMQLKKSCNRLSDILKHASIDNYPSFQKVLAMANLHLVIINLVLSLNEGSAVHSEATSIGESETILPSTTPNSSSLNVIGKSTTFSLLKLANLIAKDNKEVCTELLKYEDQLFYILINIDASLGGELLTMAFSLLDPKIIDHNAYFSTWHDRLSTISADNIEQQSIIIMTLGGLCLVDDKTNLINQNFILDTLLNKADPFPLVLLAQVEDRVIIHFCVRPNSYSSTEIFMRENPFLKGLEALEFKGKLCFDIKDVCTNKAYETYLSRVLKLYYLITLDNNDATDQLLQLGIEPNILIRMSMDSSISMLLRTVAMRLVGTVFISKNGSYSFVNYEYKDMCYSLKDLDTERFYEVFSDYLDADKKRHLDQLLQWLLNFWLVKENSEIKVAEDGLEVIRPRIEYIEFLLSVMELTFSIIDSQFVEPFFIDCISRAFVYNLIGVSEFSAEHLEEHWLVKLLNKAMISPSFSLRRIANTVVTYTLRLFSLIEKMRVIKKLKGLLSIYRPGDRHNFSPSDSERYSTELKSLITAHNQTQQHTDPLERVFSNSSRWSPILLLDWVQNYRVSKEMIIVEIPEASKFILKLTFEDLGFTSEIYKILLNLHRNLLNDSVIIQNKLAKADLILTDEDLDLMKRIADLDSVLNEGEIIEGLQREEGKLESSECLEKYVENVKKLLMILQSRSLQNIAMWVKAQNISRHYRLHICLMKVWEYLNKLPEAVNPLHPVRNAIHLTVVSLFFFVKGNYMNKKTVWRQLKPSLYNLHVPLIAALIDEAMFDSVKPDFFTEYVKATLAQCPPDDPIKVSDGIDWIEPFLTESIGLPRRELQIIACNAFINVVKGEAFERMNDNIVAQVFRILAFCAFNNHSVVRQCRKLLRHSALLGMIKEKLNSPEVVSSLLEYYNFVYLAPHKTNKRMRFEIELLKMGAEILEVVRPYVIEAIDKIGGLTGLADEGLYELVVNLNDPSVIDCAERRKTDFIWFRELMWVIARGEPWENKTGIVTFIPCLIEYAGSKHIHEISQILADYQKLLWDLKERVLLLKVNYSYIDFDPLLNAVDIVLKRLEENGVSDVYLRSAYHRRGQGESINFIKILLLALTKQERENTDATFMKNMVEQIRYVPVLKELFMPAIQRKVLLKASNMIQKLLKNCENSKTKAMIFYLLNEMLKHPDCNQESLTKVVITAGCIEMAAELMIYSKSKVKADAALSFLNCLLTYRKASIQTVLKTILIEKDYAYDLIRLFTSELTDSRRRIKKLAQDTLTSSIEVFRDSGNLRQYQQSSILEISENSKYKKGMLLCKFFELACDNCNEPFQNFMREQEIERGSVDLVEFLASYFIEVTAVLKDDDNEALDMIGQTLDTLIELTTGPCIQNQAYLASRVKIFSSINSLLAKLHVFFELMASKELDNQADKGIQIYSSMISFLIALIEGPNREAHTKVLIKRLDLELIRNQAIYIFDKFIKDRIWSVILEIGPKTKLSMGMNSILEPVSDCDFLLIRSGMKAAMFLIQLRLIDPSHPVLSLMYTPSNEDMFGEMRWFSKLFNKAAPFELKKSNAEEFYSDYIGMVELQKDDLLEQYFFVIPFKCKFLTFRSRQSIIEDVDRTTQQGQLENFLQRSKVCYAEMQHQQILCQNLTLKSFTREWNLYYSLSMLCIYVINLYFLIDLTSPSDYKVKFFTTKPNESNVVLAFGICQLFFTIMGFSGYLIEYYSTIIAQGKLSDISLELKDYYLIQNNDSIITKLIFQRILKPLSVIEARRVYYFLIDFECVYHVFFFFPISILAIFYPYLYPFLLLDIIKRSRSVRNIFDSINVNKFQLTMTMILGGFVIYIFSIFGFVYFKDCYVSCDDFDGDCEQRDADYNSFCSSLSECFISTLHLGIRMGGGIGDALKKPKEANSNTCNYWERMVFDLMFFMIVILILLNIIFGIIIDTYSGLRAKRLEVMRDIEHSCFICGVLRSDIERKQEWWSQHFMKRHSPFAYLSFIVYVQDKTINDCTGLEKYVLQQIRENKTGFFPLGEADGV